MKGIQCERGKKNATEIAIMDKLSAFLSASAFVHSAAMSQERIRLVFVTAVRKNNSSI